MTYDSDEAGKIFVGGLNWETTQENLEKHFRRYGEIVDCVVMKNNETGQSRGFGFVTFKDPDVISLVLANCPHILDGKTIDPKACMKRGAQKMKDNSDASKAFLGGLPLNVTDAELTEAFEKFGKVVDITIMFDQEKQKPRGFGFLTFDSPEALQRACEEHYVTVSGKQVECKAAQPRNSRPPPRQQSRAPYPSQAQRQGMGPSQQASSWYQMGTAQNANSYAGMPGNYQGGYMYQQQAAGYNYPGNYGAGYQNYGSGASAQYANPSAAPYANAPQTGAQYNAPSAAASSYNANTGGQYNTPPATSTPYATAAAPPAAPYNNNNNSNNNQYNFSGMGEYTLKESQFGPTKARHLDDTGGYKIAGPQNTNQPMGYHPYNKC